MKFLNETRINHNGFVYNVIAFDPSTKRYTVQFPHNGVVKTCNVQSIRGNIISEIPAHKPATQPIVKRLRSTFDAMWDRLERLPTYQDVEIDIRWETFDGFLRTIHMVDGFELFARWTGYTLDKDIKGQNTYGPETCMFISRSENASQPRKKTKHKFYPVGSRHVSKHGQWFKVIAKDRIWSYIEFEETGEIRKVTTHQISVNRVAKSVKGE